MMIYFSQFLSSTVFHIQTIMPINAWKVNSLNYKELSVLWILAKCMENLGECMKSQVWSVWRINVGKKEKGDHSIALLIL